MTVCKSETLGANRPAGFVDQISDRAHGADAVPPLTGRGLQSSPHFSGPQPVVASTRRFDSVDYCTVLIGPGYWDTKESMVRSVTPSTVACATKILSKGSLWIRGRLSMATT
jgi:hypothetical protein